jgi:hypothetical protein
MGHDFHCFDSYFLYTRWQTDDWRSELVLQMADGTRVGWNPGSVGRWMFSCFPHPPTTFFTINITSSITLITIILTISATVVTRFLNIII